MLNQAKNYDESNPRHPKRTKLVEGSRNIFIVGIKGVAMANLAVILRKMGKTVAGSDVAEQFITDEILKKYKIAYQIGFDPKKIPTHTDLIVYSGANQGDQNPQVITAKKQGVSVISQAQLLGELSKLFKMNIAVCGCHGKTTTSSLLSYALIKLGAKPSYLVGSSDFNGLPGGDFNGSKYFVVEADEYAVNPPHDLTPKFHHLNPDLILCTNIDFDHPDVYRDLSSTKKAFSKFFAMNASINRSIRAFMFFCADDKNLMSIADRLAKDSYLTYGYSNTADLRIVNYQPDAYGSSFQVELNYKRHSGNPRLGGGRPESVLIKHERRSIQIDLKLAGEKNVSNAAGVILILLELGFSLSKIKKAIGDFTGAKRRFELVFEDKGTYLFDDYAHHPAEIEATIKAARAKYPRQRVIVIFQPHTYSRTQRFLPGFAKSLSLADKTIILPVFASARENPGKFSVSSSGIATINPLKLTSVNSKSELTQYLKSIIKYQDIIFTMGAGDVYKLSDDIIRIILEI
ncbi:UDP-N-acetylmuramate--L-alanine ligase [Candidatus Roizmanbacteria bacterium RIFCSPHIGHO2_01_FULL_39_12c]|uniref:UDP-N-acetylmuramate--L-alanine ligase n=1 Tax=Candidatus Roizmanbacteria bacterium RIFCSPHIGHO2_01_FULL_39_12c TaxID=1802031 RepID=A0A1F7GEM3_9BACT|nr:MAG: UDP-N-acetylmuramate--L-alanine ligase [Candidatus Roizmanbacteria bacterium RIFCSPHIGHO2_01_FULL_39_12c]OGK48049.1 MAG: UDP-N-acetylmuramate--L-alanine ligase [Candidatus Roizmanbacteria bacterium RIFCSPLOWO2_01_FULL_40_13]